MTMTLLEVAAVKISLLCFDPHLCLVQVSQTSRFNYVKVTLQLE